MKQLLLICLGLSTAAPFAHAAFHFNCQSTAPNGPEMQLDLTKHTAMFDGIEFSNYFGMDPNASTRDYGTAGQNYYRLSVPTTMVTGEADSGSVTLSWDYRQTTYDCRKN